MKLPSNITFPTIVLAAGAAVLIVAVALGQSMGDRVMQQATEQLQGLTPSAVTPAPDSSEQPYGPDWKRSQALSAATDPRFPDPRVPPQPLPTPLPAPKATPTPHPTPTVNENIPIWRRQPLPKWHPTAAPEVDLAPSPEVSPAASAPPEANPPP